MKRLRKVCALFLAVILSVGILLPLNASAADDTVSCTQLGTCAPTPALLSEYSFLSCENNGLAEGSEVTSIPLPYSAITTDSPVSVDKVPTSWLTWSNGFTGKVYDTDVSGYSLDSRQLTMPEYCLGVILYVESDNISGCYNFTVTTAGMAESIVESVIGFGGAKGYAFLSENDYISTISIAAESAADGFAFGELYVSYGVIVPQNADIENHILSAFSEILGVDASRLAYTVATPAGESQVYPAMGAYDLTFTIDGGSPVTYGKGLRIVEPDQSAPPAPVLSCTSNSITAEPVANCEYSLDNANWQDCNVFTGLSPATEYTVYMRYMATATLHASFASSSAITTMKLFQPAPWIPILSRTASSIIVKPVAGCEYSLDNTHWQTSNVFTGLSSCTRYTVYMRYAETATQYASTVSSASAFTLSRYTPCWVPPLRAPIFLMLR